MVVKSMWATIRIRCLQKDCKVLRAFHPRGRVTDGKIVKDIRDIASIMADATIK